jgi:hypothetical protein
MPANMRDGKSSFAASDGRYWQLPTGSVIAYSEYDPPQGVAVKPEAVVYLHGGPGARQAPFDQQIYGSFAANGFRVFLYDQAGSGLSGFPPHLRDYTVARSVADLPSEARRKALHRLRRHLGFAHRPIRRQASQRFFAVPVIVDRPAVVSVTELSVNAPKDGKLRVNLSVHFLPALM